VVLDGVDKGEHRAHLAYGIYLHRLRALIASMAAAMNGMDGLVFTGGAGEGSARLRHDTCSGLEFLGVALDDSVNEADEIGDRLLSPRELGVAVAVVTAREDIEIARLVRQLLLSKPPTLATDPSSQPPEAKRWGT
jgi:acetate kinase